MSLYRRPKANDGCSMHAERVMRVRQSLMDSVLGAPQPIERKAPPVYHGPKKPNGAPPVKLTDEQVLRIRALKEFLGLTAREISTITGVSMGEIRTVLMFNNRVHLVPGPEHAA